MKKTQSSDIRLRHLIGFLCIAGLSNGACALPMQTVHVDGLKLDYPSPLVAKRNSMPLYVVLDPLKVPNRVVIKEHGLKPIPVESVRTFVSQHLKAALSKLFESVHVVAPDAATPSSPHLLATVTVDRLGSAIDKVADAHGRFVGGRAFGELTWSFAWRPHDSDRFTFTHSNKVRGSVGLIRVEETGAMLASTFGRAVEGLLSALKVAQMRQ